MTTLTKNLFKKTALIVAGFSLAFFASSQTATETQVFTASGTSDAPTVISFDIPDDITVNGGENIESIKILEIKTNATPNGIPLPLECGDFYSYRLALDGTAEYSGDCEGDIEGHDITNASEVELSSKAEMVGSIMGYTIDIKLTIEVTYTPAAPCEVDAGDDTTITPCRNEPINLMNLLGGSPQTGGEWKAPDGSIVSNVNITTSDTEGEYVYTYRVEEDVDCFDEAELTIDVQSCDYLSVQKNILENVSIYPNPTNDLINIKGLSGGEYQITILDLSGRVVQATKTFTSNTTLNLSGIQNGIYLARITKDNAEQVTRIVKQ